MSLPSAVLGLIALLILVDSYLVLRKRGSIAEHFLGERYAIRSVRFWVAGAWFAVSGILVVSAVLIGTQ